MLGVLLESRARRPRRTGGAALSVAAHVALIGLATAATVRTSPTQKEAQRAKLVYFTPAPAPRTSAMPPAERTSTVPRPVLRTLVVLDITPPSVVPPSLPAINPAADPTPEVFTTSAGGKGASNGRPGGLLDSSEPESPANEWRGSEVLMHITSSGKPRYPETLRQSGIEGSVLVQFTVDTLGRVDMTSVRILRSTHDLFTQAVRVTLPSFQFRPAEVGGRRVAALAQMPFEFQLHK